MVIIDQVALRLVPPTIVLHVSPCERGVDKAVHHIPFSASLSLPHPRPPAENRPLEGAEGRNGHRGPTAYIVPRRNAHARIDCTSQAPRCHVGGARPPHQRLNDPPGGLSCPGAASPLPVLCVRPLYTICCAAGLALVGGAQSPKRVWLLVNLCKLATAAAQARALSDQGRPLHRCKVASSEAARGPWPQLQTEPIRVSVEPSTPPGWRAHSSSSA